MSKKKIIAIVLFIFLGLFMFTFANPGEIKPVLKDPIKDVVKPEDNDLNNDNDQNITIPVVNPVTNIPNIKVEPKRVVILYGDKYDVMTGVTLDSVEKLEINADITDTTKLNIGTYTITYTVGKDDLTKASTRELVVLNPESDEDNDGFTNEEEMKGEDPTDPFNPESHPETIDPIIKLLGNNPYKMALGTKYVEAGVEIELDPHDNITKESDVKVDSNLDVDSIGKYTLTYTITDRYGKSASVTRDVEVFKDENGNNIPDEDEAHYTVKFEAGDHGTLSGTLVYENILTGLTFENAGIIIPSVTVNSGFKFIGWEPTEPTSETLVTSDLTYIAKYDIDDSLIQTGIEVTLKPNTQLQFQVNSNIDIKNYLIVNRVFKDGHKEEITSYTTDFSTANVGEDITLTVTDGEFTNKDYTYDIIYEEAYDTQFVVKFNLSKNFVRYIPKLTRIGWSYDWNYNNYKEETIRVDEDFLEITETYLENIEIKDIKVEYVDGTKQPLETIKNEFTVNGYQGSTAGIRWSNYKNNAFYNPVYRTSSINSTNIKYVYITYEITFSTYNKKNYTLKFENRNGEFVAISEETN